MGETIRILMVATFLIVTFGDATAQSVASHRNGNSAKAGYRHVVRFTPAARVSSSRAPSASNDLTPVGQPELPTQQLAQQKLYKPQGPGGFSIPDSLGQVGGAIGNTLRQAADVASAASDRLKSPQFSGVDPNLAVPRSGGPTTAPNPRRDNSWTRNTPGTGTTGVPSTAPRQNRSSASPFGGNAFGGQGVTTVAGTQDPNSLEARMMEQRRQQDLAARNQNSPTSGSRNPTSSQSNALGETANFGRIPTGMNLPQRDTLADNRTGSFGTEFNRNTAAQNNQRTFGPPTAAEAGFDPSLYNRGQNGQRSQNGQATLASGGQSNAGQLAANANSLQLPRQNGQTNSAFNRQDSAQAKLGLPANKENTVWVLQEWTPRQLTELGAMFGIQANDPRLVNPQFMNALHKEYQEYLKELAAAYQLSLNDPRLADPISMKELHAEYQQYLKENNATSNQRLASQGQVQQGVGQNNPSQNGARLGSPLGYPAPRDTGLRNQYDQSLTLQQPAQQYQMQPPQLQQPGNSGYNFPDSRIASRTGISPSVQPSPSAAPASNRRPNVDPRLSEEMVAKLPLGAWGFDKYMNPIDQNRNIVDQWGDPVSDEEAWELTLGRKQRAEREKEELRRKQLGIDGNRWATAGLNPNGNLNQTGQPPRDPRLAMNGVPNGQFASGQSFNASRPSLQDPPSSSDTVNGQGRTPIDHAGIGNVKNWRSNPWVNFFLLCSIAANVFFFVWLHRCWHKLRSVIASGRMAASSPMAAE